MNAEQNAVTFELQPRHDARKSFYGKARVTERYEDMETGQKVIELRSYGTNVANIYVGTGATIAEVYGTYSPTTLRHIKEFLKQNGFKADTKKQIEEDYA